MPNTTISPVIANNYLLEVVTPTFIGDTSDKDYLIGEDYYWADATFEYCFIDKRGFQLALTNQQRSNYIDSLLKAETENAESVLMDICEKQNLVTRKVKCIFGKKVRKHITNGFGEVYIPGSTIKGAIRSIIGNYLMTKLNKKHFNHEELFGKINNNLMRLIQVGDVSLDKTASIFPMKIYSGDVKSDLQSDGNILNYDGEGMWKHDRIGGHGPQFDVEGFVSIFETLQPESKGNLRLNFTNFDELKKLMQIDKRPLNSEYFNEFAGNQLIDIARKQMNEYLEQEIEFFDKFKNKDFPKSIELLEKLKIINNKPGSALLRLGQGSGYHAITGNWKYKDHTQTEQATEKDRQTRQQRPINAIKYKTRKIAFNKEFSNEKVELMMPGFVKISKKE